MNRTIKGTVAIGAILFAAAALLSAAGTSSRALASENLPADRCDAEAGSEHDLQRNFSFRPVASEDIRIGVALSFCREAHNNGGGARQTFQLARVLHEAGQRPQAMAMLKQAAEEGHALAMVNYGVELAEKGEHEEGFALYQKAAATGNILAAFNLGVAYRDGVGTPVNGGLAAQWFERASAAKDNLGAFNLAVLLDEGTLVPEDNRRAARFYRLAADRGNVDAMINLALILENGEGVRADPARAAALYKRAASKGDDFARTKIIKAAMVQADIDPTTTASILPVQHARLVLAKSGRAK